MCQHIEHKELLHIRTKNGISYGGSQTWYSTWRKRLSGCGPTTASNLLWYLASSRPAECGRLFESDAREAGQMLRLMEEVWKYVTPGIGGLYKTEMLARGAVQYGQEHGVPLRARVLEIPADTRKRPKSEEVLAFLQNALQDDLPVAFLNLDNGTVSDLESWHWVTLVALDNEMQAQIYDQSRQRRADLGEWLASTKKGGGFVAVEPV